MNIKEISLHHFRNHTKSHFAFGKTTVIVGKNTIGKTNILEAIHFLSLGKSFRAEKDSDAIQNGQDFAKVEAIITSDEQDRTNLSLSLIKKNNFFYKKYAINGIPKRQNDFTSHIHTVLFEPADLETITSSPSRRRKYLDSVLTQASKEYKTALSVYEKALKHRNKMLHNIKEGKKYAQKHEFEYWDNLLITHGATITALREQYIAFLNTAAKETFPFSVTYDKSTITRERLDHYFDVEQKIGVTLVGPQRDDILFYFPDTEKQVAEFGSRGEQRLTILQMKLLEIEYLKKETGEKPILLLDDIFSELDSTNIQKIIPLLDTCQTIITTTHKEFIPESMRSSVDFILLGEKNSNINLQ